MTSKQKLALVAAQYIARARDATRSGDALAAVSESISEERARAAIEDLEREGLIDREGILTLERGPGGSDGTHAVLGKIN